MDRCATMLEQCGVKNVMLDPHEHPYCLQPDHVAGICYLQNGFFDPLGTGLPPPV